MANENEGTASERDPIVVWLEEIRDFAGANTRSREMAQRAIDRLSTPAAAANAPDRSRGLIGKFAVARVDGSDAPGGRHEGCRYFVLDMTHDRHAIPALRAYAESCEADGYLELGKDLRSAANELEAATTPAAAAPAPDQESPAPASTKIDRLVEESKAETERGRQARRQS
jgi:hypothetical protein